MAFIELLPLDGGVAYSATRFVIEGSYERIDIRDTDGTSDDAVIEVQVPGNVDFETEATIRRVDVQRSQLIIGPCQYRLKRVSGFCGAYVETGMTTASGSASAFSAAKYAIQQNTADVNILVIGDSTGNDSAEWVYLFGQWLGATYPTHSVSYRLWDDVGNVYAAAVALDTGTGANTIRIWNASVAGAVPELLTGSKFAAAIASTTPVAVIWNHGHNLTGLHDSELRGRFMGPMEDVRAAFPSAPQIMLIQNPRRDDALYDQIATAIRAVSALRGDVATVDVKSLFDAQNKAPSLYADSVHPSAAGSALFLQAVTSRWGGAAVTEYVSLPAWFATAGPNLLSNGDFSAFAGALPDGWSKSGNGTVSKELTIVDGASPYSVKIVNGASSTFLFQTISAAPVAGQSVTLAIRMYSPTGNDINACQMRLFSNQPGFPLTVNRTGQIAQNGWRWVVIAGESITAAATLVGAYLYASAQTTAGTVYLDSAILVAGDIPRNMV